MDNIELILSVTIFLIVIIIYFVIFAVRYKRVPPNKAMVVFGKPQKTKGGKRSYIIITGGAKFIIPLIEEIAFIPLDARPLEIRLERVRIGTHINIPEVASYRFGLSLR